VKYTRLLGGNGAGKSIRAIKNSRILTYSHLSAFASIAGKLKLQHSNSIIVSMVLTAYCLSSATLYFLTYRYEKLQYFVSFISSGICQKSQMKEHQPKHSREFIATR